MKSPKPPQRNSRRCAKWGDGRMPLAYPSGEEAQTAEWREEVRLWKSLGVTHLTLANYYESRHLHRIAGRALGDHIAAMRPF